MRRLLQLALLTLVAASVACEQDFYEKGDSENSYLRADFIEAFVDGGGQVRRVVTDDDDELLLAKPFTATWIQRTDTVYRAVMYHSRKGGGEAVVRSLSRVTTIPLSRDTAAARTVTSDPLGFESAWIATNRKYLNLGLVLKTGALEGTNARQQTVGMLLQRIDTTRAGNDGKERRTAHLRLVHSQGDVPQYYSQRVYVSMPLQRLTVDTLYLTIDTYDGVVRKGFLLTKD